MNTSREKTLWRIRGIVSLLGLTLAVTGAWMAYSSPTNQIWRVINAVTWSVGPPLWFVVEYFHLFPRYDGDDQHIDDLKYGQGLAKAFWAGIAALLVVLYQQGKQISVGELETRIETLEAKLQQLDPTAD